MSTQLANEFHENLMTVIQPAYVNMASSFNKAGGATLQQTLKPQEPIVVASNYSDEIKKQQQINVNASIGMVQDNMASATPLLKLGRQSNLGEACGRLSEIAGEATQALFGAFSDKSPQPDFEQQLDPAMQMQPALRIAQPAPVYKPPGLF